MSTSPSRHFDSVPALLRRSGSDSSTSSTASEAIGTPTDRITHRADGDFGGEPGLTIECMAKVISEILFKDPPLVEGPSALLQPRFTHEEVHQLCTVLKDDYSLETTTTPSHNSKLKEKLSIYHVTIPAEIANSIGFQEATPMLRRNYGCICLSPMGKTEPRPTPEDSDEGEKMDENTFTAAVDSKLNEIADNDFDALYI